MMQNIVTAATALVAAIIAYKMPSMGDQASAQLAAGVIAFLLGWFRPAPGTTTTTTKKVD